MQLAPLHRIAICLLLLQSKKKHSIPLFQNTKYASKSFRKQVYTATSCLSSTSSTETRLNTSIAPLPNSATCSKDRFNLSTSALCCSANACASRCRVCQVLFQLLQACSYHMSCFRRLWSTSFQDLVQKRPSAALASPCFWHAYSANCS